MIDWLTLVLDTPVELVPAVRAWAHERPHLMRYTPATGDVEWDVPAREVVRSDSHQVTLSATPSGIVVSGSPARAMGQASNVFGSCDVVECSRAHIALVGKLTGWALPDYQAWRCTRIDVTYNYDLGNLRTVRQALAILRQADGGRYKVRATAETVYWSPGARTRGGKAYAKGPHLRYQVKRGQAQATEEELELADRLLRLELRLGGEWFRRARQVAGPAWWVYDYQREHEAYFREQIGSVEVSEMTVQDRVIEAAPTEGQGLAAYRTWCLIKAVGHQNARESMPRSTWYRHLRILREAGLTWADLAAGEVLPFRRRVIELREPVLSWDELRMAS